MNRLVWHPAVRFTVQVAVGVLALLTALNIIGWLNIVFGAFFTGLTVVIFAVWVAATLDKHTRRKP